MTSPRVCARCDFSLCKNISAPHAGLFPFMAHPLEQETIVALATPPGKGSIAAIRISGPRAWDCVRSLLRGENTPEHLSSHRVVLAWLYAPNGEKLDQVTLVRYQAPRSYTGEDVVEIFCHGGRLIPNLIIEQLCTQGCRLAQPGEFTQRALLNGKLDLIQAEAVADLIEAESPAYLHGALAHLEGAFSRKLAELREKLLHACALLELGLDFSEEDVEFADRAELRNELVQLENMIVNLLHGFTRGQALKEGWRIAIIGKPNVGKSSLMNALLKYDRVIVSEIPGTTRDTIDERIFINGLLFRLIDTAGIREHAGELEKIGIERSRAAAQNADVILFVTDDAKDGDEGDRILAKECFDLKNKNGSIAVIQVRNKSDLPTAKEPFGVDEKNARAIRVSAIAGAGIDELEAAIAEAVMPLSNLSGAEVQHINLRQKLCLENARTALAGALSSLDKNLSAEFITIDLREVIHQLGVLIGEVTSEDVLGEIFSKFCIGK